MILQNDNRQAHGKFNWQNNWLKAVIIFGVFILLWLNKIWFYIYINPFAFIIVVIGFFIGLLIIILSLGLIRLVTTPIFKGTRLGRKIPNNLIVIILILVFLTAGYLSQGFFLGIYKGDGKPGIIQVGHFSLKLGQIDLNKPSEITYSFWGLPPLDMTLGFRIVFPKEIDVMKWSIDKFRNHNLPPPLKLNPYIKLTMINEKNETVVDEKGFLGDWTWSCFGNKTSETYIYGAGCGSKEYADEGMGTFFKPRPYAHYNLKLEVKPGKETVKGIRAELKFEYDVPML